METISGARRVKGRIRLENVCMGSGTARGLNVSPTSHTLPKIIYKGYLTALIKKNGRWKGIL